MTGPSQPIVPADLDTTDDLPIGQVIRRFGERRLGVIDPDNGLSAPQLSLVRGFDERARRLGDQSPGLMQTRAAGRGAGLHLDVGARHLPLYVDTGFGRLGAAGTQDLIPSGPWRMRIDVSLLQLWLEEELKAQEALYFEAAPPSPDRRPAAASATPPAAVRLPALDRLPPAAREVMERKREEIRQAMLAAVRGDAAPLARLTHGEEAAKILSELRQRGVAQPEAQPGAQAPAPTALDHGHLERLAQTMPTLAVDASAPDFDFAAAAATIIRRARQGAAREVAAAARSAQPTPAARPGALAAAADQAQRRIALRGARMFGPTPDEQAVVDREALARTPFEATSLVSLPLGAQAPSGVAMAALGADLGQALARLTPADAPSGQDRQLGPAWLALPTPVASGADLALATRRALTGGAPRAATAMGQQSLKALTPRRDGRRSAPSAWLFDGGRGVLLEGLDDDPRPQGPRRAMDPEGGWTAPQTPALTRALLDAIAQRRSAQPDAPSQPQATSRLAPTLLSVTGSADYRADGPGDFAAILAGGLAANLAGGPGAEQARATAQGPRLADGATASTEATARVVAGAEAQGHVETHRRLMVQLQDVLLSESHLPALTRSIDQLGRAVALLTRFSQAPPEAAQQAPALRALAEARLAASQGMDATSRTARVAEELAALIRRGAPLGPRPTDPRRARSAYSDLWWDSQLTSLQPEAAEAPTPDRARAALEATIETLQSALDGSRRLEVARLAQLAAPAPVTERPAAVSGATRDAATAPQAAQTRALRLFSPEKTMALLAPQLESGGLLDATGRRELTAALEALATAPGTSAGAQRRISTPFGTLLVRLEDDGRVTVDTEEIASVSPSVSLKAASRAAQGAEARLPDLLAGLAPADRADAPLVRALAQRLAAQPAGRLTPQTLEQIEVLLGGATRAERASSVRLDPLDPEQVARRLGLSPDSPGGRALQQAMARPGRRRNPLAELRDVSAGALIEVFADSEQAARVISAMEREGLLSAPGALATARALTATARTAAGATVAPAAGAAQATAAITEAPGTSAQVTPGRLAEVLERLSQRRAHEHPSGAAAPSAHKAPAWALGAELARAAQTRSIGALGSVGMGRRALGGMSRAELAFALPFLQRAAGGPARLDALTTAATASPLPPRSPEDRTSAMAAPGAAAVGASTPTSIEALTQARAGLDRLFELGLSLGQGPELFSGQGRLGTRLLDVDRAEGWMLEVAPSATRGLEQRGQAGATRDAAAPWAGRGGRAYDGVSTSARELFAPMSMSTARAAARYTSGAAGRRAAIERSMSAPRATEWSSPAGPMARAATSPLRPQALGGALIKELRGIEGVLSSLDPARAALAPWARSSGSSYPGAGAMALPETGAASVGVRPEAARLGMGRAGRAGIWSPSGVERLLQTPTEALIASRGGFEATHVAPTIFRQVRQRAGFGQAPMERDQMVAFGQAAVAEALRQAPLGLKLHRATRGGRDESAGTLAVGPASGSAPSWMSSTLAQRGVERLLASLDGQPQEAKASGGQAGMGRGAMRGPDMPQLDPKPRPAPPLTGRLVSRSERKESSRASSGGSYQGENISERTLFTPPAPQLGGPVGLEAAGLAPRAAMPSSSGGTVERAEGADRKMLAHQTGVPSQENIEDMAREVLAELKRRWSYELERRGIE